MRSLQVFQGRFERWRYSQAKAISSKREFIWHRSRVWYWKPIFRKSWLPDCSEGRALSRLSGEGIVFLEIDGSVVEYDLDEGEQIVVSTGYVAAMDESCTMELLSIKGVKNVLFGGEHLFNTVVTGPGRVFLQTMPLIGVAHALRPYMPSGGDINIDTSGD